MANLDRFSQGLPDPQEAKIIDRCSYCGLEIYENDFYITLERDCYCKFDCLINALGAELHYD